MKTPGGSDKTTLHIFLAEPIINSSYVMLRFNQSQQSKLQQ